MNKCKWGYNVFNATVMVGALLASCGVMSPASAATIPNVYADDNGVAFSLTKAVAIRHTYHGVTVLTGDAQTRTYTSATDSLWTKIAASATFANFVQASGGWYVNMALVNYVDCEGTWTAFYFDDPSQTQYYDGSSCDTMNRVIAGSN